MSIMVYSGPQVKFVKNWPIIQLQMYEASLVNNLIIYIVKSVDNDIWEVVKYAYIQHAKCPFSAGTSLKKCFAPVKQILAWMHYPLLCNLI